MESARLRSTADLHAGSKNQQGFGFYEYYHILQHSGTDDDESEEYGANKDRELKGYTDGLHSPFGIIGQIKEKRGYTHDHVLWGESWIVFLMENVDQPRYIKGSRPVPTISSAKEAAGFASSRIKIIS